MNTPKRNKTKLITGIGFIVVFMSMVVLLSIAAFDEIYNDEAPSPKIVSCYDKWNNKIIGVECVGNKYELDTKQRKIAAIFILLAIITVILLLVNLTEDSWRTKTSFFGRFK